MVEGLHSELKDFKRVLVRDCPKKGGKGGVQLFQKHYGLLHLLLHRRLMIEHGSDTRVLTKLKGIDRILDEIRQKAERGYFSREEIEFFAERMLRIAADIEGVLYEEYKEVAA